MKKKKIIILFVIMICIIFGVFTILKMKDTDKKQNSMKRYEQIKASINKELERYLYVIGPRCQKDGGTPLITHKDLVYNAGMAKEEFLDVDGKSYCKAYIYATCIEDGKWSWKTTISCKDYQDKDYKDWDSAFETKK